jgi:hypothetical protein
MSIPTPPARTTLVSYSMVKLPEVPMMPRLADDRLGFFGYAVTDYGRPDHETVRRNFIARFRLEKKDPTAAKSEPVQPIVFYVDPATPAKWVPYVKRAIEAWQPAFEEAGFLRAIQAKEAPKDDPTWSMDDARVSAIRWIPSTTANAMGPHVSDPRSGEILEAKVEIYHNVMQLATDWYFAQAGALDKRVQKLPMPDELMGEILVYIVTHEVGHSLGLPHNFKASATYTIDQIRDKNWVKQNGHVPTLMDYSRFNYVAQPEDGLNVQDLIPKIGPYDVLSIRWGYTPIPGARTPDAEKPALDAMLKVQETTPWLRFSNARAAGTDPGEQSEAVGDMDAVKATTLGIKNLKRVLELVPGATQVPGEDFDRLEHIYQAVVGQWRTELGHVVSIVGGWDNSPKWGTDKGIQFTPISKARQQEAVRFFTENLFKTPTWILKEEILRKLQPTSGLTEILGVQRGILNGLLNASRTSRLQEHEAVLGDKAYTVHQLLADLRGGIFTEEATGARVDPFRRDLQRVYVELLGTRLNTVPAPGMAMGGLGVSTLRVNANDDTRGAIRAELKAIQAMCGKASADRATSAHLADLKDQIARILDPKFAPAAGGSGTTGAPGRISNVIEY